MIISSTYTNTPQNIKPRLPGPSEVFSWPSHYRPPHSKELTPPPLSRTRVSGVLQSPLCVPVVPCPLVENKGQARTIVPVRPTLRHRARP